MSFIIITVILYPSDTSIFFFKECTLLELNMLAIYNIKYRFIVLINFQIHSIILTELLYKVELVSELSNLNFILFPLEWFSEEFRNISVLSTFLRFMHCIQ